MKPKSSFLRGVVFGALAFIATLLSSGLTAQTLSSRVLLAPRNPQALAAAADAGVMPSSQRVSLTLTLTPEPARAAALDQYLSALTTAGSPGYHQWLSPAQFAAAYGAKPAQLAAAQAWAQEAGLTVEGTSPAGTRMTVSGPAGRVQTAFATSLHLYQLDAAMYYAAAIQPSLPVDAAPIFAAVEGLDDLPASRPLGDFKVLTAVVDANATAVLPLSATTALSAAQLPEYTQLFRQAAAQGITLLLPDGAGSFADAVAIADSTALAGSTPRPTWQSAPGLPADNFRATPDLTVGSLSVFTQTLKTLAAGGRLGNIAPVLYTLAPVAGIFSQPDATPAGTWLPVTGLGTIDPARFADAFPRGTGMSFTSFSATNYAPNHGQSTSFTSNVTSGTGGATPTGTVSFVTSAGLTLGTVTLAGGSATFSIGTLDSGSYILNAVYSGDANYASSQSPTAQIYVAPEPSQLSAIISGTATVGSNYTIVVTDAATLGAPNGAITVTISGTMTSYTAALRQASATSSTATFSIPATAPGGITLSITCSPSLNYSCTNPYTTTVQIAKATPTLSISYTPNPPVSGQQINLSAVVSTVGSAPAPTGNVRFFDNGTTLNAAALSGGTANTTGTVPTTGTHSITATYDGDPNYNSVSTTAGSSSSATINTTTNLISSATTVNAGSSITFTATIVPAGTGPLPIGGSVTFSDGGTPLGTQNVSNGVATLTTNTLSSTTGHTITAVYSGDATYTASTSGTVVLTAGTANNATTTALTASTANPTHGSSVTFSAMVAPPTGGATPAGTVTFFSATGQLGQSTLNNGVATFSTNLLPGGANSITATYNGGTTLNASTSSALTITVAPEPVQLALVLPANPTFGGVLAVQVTVTGASGVSYPTGTITIQPSGNGYTTSSTGGVISAGTNSTGSANVNLQETAAGSVILTATYTGDRNFAAAGPVSASVTIARAASTTTLSYTPTPPVVGQPLLLTAKVGFVPGFAPTGVVQFKDGATVLGSGTLDSAGSATLSTTLSAGNHTLSAAYAGDTNYLPGTSPSQNTATGSGATTTTLTLSPPIVVAGSPVTLTAAVGPSINGLALSGTVQFVSAGKVLCTVAVAGGSASCTINPTVVGSQTITASYLGDANYAASSSAAATLQTTSPAGALTATVTPSNVTGNTSATVTAVVTAPVGTVPTGSITATILNGTGTVQTTYTTPLPGTGTSNTATVSIPVVSPVTTGGYTITVACLNTNFTCSSVSLPFTVTSTTVNGSATLTAAVNPASGLPGSAASVAGTITAATGTTLTGTITATITGVAGAVYVYTLPGTQMSSGTYAIPIIIPAAVGTYSVSVTCNSTAFSCTPITASLTSTTTTLLPTTTSLMATASLTVSGATVLTAGVTTAATGATQSPTGSVSFYDGTILLGIQPYGTAPMVSVSFTPSAAATHSYTAVYSGDAVYSASTSPAVTGTTTGIATAAAITLSASTTSAISGTNVVLTANVTGLTTKGTAPTGTVTFYITGSNARSLGTVTLVANGPGSALAVLTTTGLPSGTLTINAVYSGDTTFTTVASNSITLGLTDFNITFTPASLTIVRGGGAFTTATVNFLGGLNGSVALGCTPATDSAVTCSFSPAVLSGAGTSRLNVQTTSPRAALTPPAGLAGKVLGGISLAALFGLLLPGRNRRRWSTPLLLLVSLGMVCTVGCGQNNFPSPFTAAGSPLGTTILTITAAASDGTSTVRHTYYVQVTIE